MSRSRLLGSLALVGALLICSPAGAVAPPLRTDERQVAIELRIVTISDAVMMRLVAEKGPPPGESYLDDRQVYALLEAAQQDRQTSVMQLPRVTMGVGDDRGATVEVTEERSFVTGVEWVPTGPTKTPRPKSETVVTGLKCSLRPRLDDEGRTVRVRARLDYSFLNPAEPKVFPICWAVSPVDGGKAGAGPVVFTQYIQQPQRSALAFDRALSIPAGKTALLTGWVHDRQVSEDLYLSVLGHLPGVGELLRVPRTINRREHRFVLITPRVVRPDSGPGAE